MLIFYETGVELPDGYRIKHHHDHVPGFCPIWMSSLFLRDRLIKTIIGGDTKANVERLKAWLEAQDN